MALALLPEDFVCMNDRAKHCPFRVKLAYARKDNLLFGERIYRKDAKLWLYTKLARVVCRAAEMCYETHGVRFVLYDGLRTIEAQEAMMMTKRVRENLHWLEEPRLLSKPGGGAHPRGMAIDIGLENEHGALLDMGCPFDFLSEKADAEHNPAHREHKHSKEIQNNRAILDDSMIMASKELETEITFLPEEWWDFRLTARYFKRFTPLSERDLPEMMKLMR